MRELKKPVNFNKKLQFLLKNAVVEENVIRSFSTICGVDVAYKDTQQRTFSVTCAIVTNNIGKVVEKEYILQSTPRTPYISGHFALRELTRILNVLKQIKTYDLLLVDANGKLHSQEFGLACHVGICIAKPTIGIAKSLLCGEVLPDPYFSTFKEEELSTHPIMLNNKIVGVKLIINKTKNKKREEFFISVGNLISLSTAVSTVVKSLKEGKIAPIQLAHEHARKILQETDWTSILKSKSSIPSSREKF